MLPSLLGRGGRSPHSGRIREGDGMSTQISGKGIHRLNLFARATLAGAVFFAASALLLPLLSEYTLAQDYISELAIGRFGFVQTLAFVALGLGSLALATGIREATRGSWGSLVGSVLFGLFGVGVLLDAFFPIDRGGMQSQTVVGTVHILSASVAFVCVVLALVALVTFFLPIGEWAGLFQRIFVGVVIAWMILAALRLRSIAEDTSTPRPRG